MPAWRFLQPLRQVAPESALRLLLIGGTPALLALGCSIHSLSPPASAPTAAPSGAPAATAPATAPTGGRGFPVQGPWVSFYGNAAQMGDLAKIAATYRIINLDADPVSQHFSRDQIAQLRAGGRNRVISYFNLGSVERSRDYWSQVPSAFVPAKDIPNLGPYEGYPDEVWMNLANPDWQHLLLDYVAPRLVAQGIDGFYFDNLEVVEHGTDANGACDTGCAQGALDFVAKLRAKYPTLLFVMQNATGTFTQTGTTGGQSFASLLDGVAHEEVFSEGDQAALAQNQTYHVATHQSVVAELKAWQALNLKPGGQPFWIATEDYVNRCDNTADAQTIAAQSRALGFSPYVSDQSASQTQVCFW